MGILSADKKKKKESTPSAGSSNKGTHEKEEDIVRDQINQTRINRKEEDEKSIQKVWLGSVYDWISNRMSPFSGASMASLVQPSGQCGRPPLGTPRSSWRILSQKLS